MKFVLYLETVLFVVQVVPAVFEDDVLSRPVQDQGLVEGGVGGNDGVLGNKQTDGLIRSLT